MPIRGCGGWGVVLAYHFQASPVGAPSRPPSGTSEALLKIEKWLIFIGLPSSTRAVTIIAEAHGTEAFKLRLLHKFKQMFYVFFLVAVLPIIRRTPILEALSFSCESNTCIGWELMLVEMAPGHVAYFQAFGSS